MSVLPPTERELKTGEGFSSRLSRVTCALMARDGVRLHQVLAETGSPWAPMRLWRLLHGEQKWTAGTARPFLEWTAQRAGHPTSAVQEHLEGGQTNGDLLELESCTYWPATKKGAAELSRVLAGVFAAATPWVHAGRQLPFFALPADVQPLCIRSILRAARVNDRAVATAWAEWWGGMHDVIFPGDADAIAPVKGRVMIAQGDLIAALAGSRPLEDLDDFDRADAVESIGQICERGGSFEVLAGRPNSDGTHQLQKLGNVATLLIVNGTFVLKRACNSAVWATCAADVGPTAAAFVDENVDALERLGAASIVRRTAP